MKKSIIYIFISLLIVGFLIYFFGENGLWASLMGFLGLGGSKVLSKLEKKGLILDKKASDIKKDIKKIQEKRENIKIKDLSPEEEKDYWKKL